MQLFHRTLSIVGGEAVWGWSEHGGEAYHFPTYNHPDGEAGNDATKHVDYLRAVEGLEHLLPTVVSELQEPVAGKPELPRPSVARGARHRVEPSDAFHSLEKRGLA